MSAVVLSPKQVAEMLAVSVRWVYSNARLLGGSKVGGKLFFTQDGVNHALQRGEAEEKWNSQKELRR